MTHSFEKKLAVTSVCCSF